MNNPRAQSKPDEIIYAPAPHPEFSSTCTPLPTESEIPPYKPPDCKKRDCECPEVPGKSSDCFDELIERQTADVSRGDKAKTFKADLEAFRAKATAGSQEYTQEKYERFCTQWVDQDKQIADLIHKLECTVDCWECVVDCHICALIDKMREAQVYLDGRKVTYPVVKNLYDLQYWLARDKDIKERRFKRIEAVLNAWEKPAKTIDAVLTENAKTIADSLKLLGTDPGKAIYDVFFKLVPKHLAVAPTNGRNWGDPSKSWETKIQEKWTKFCQCDDSKDKDDCKDKDDKEKDDCKNEDYSKDKQDLCCDHGTPDVCCGVDFGELSLRQQLIGLQLPYLIKPALYFDLICCIATARYVPAKQAQAEAEVKLAEVGDKINRTKSVIANGLKNFEQDAKGSIPTAIDCCKYKHKDDDKTC